MGRKLDELAVLEKLNAGLSCADIAKLLDYEVEQVEAARVDLLARKLVRGNAKSPGAQMSHAQMRERRQEMAKLADAGETHQAIAERFGCSLASVSNAVKQFGKVKRPRAAKQTKQAKIFKIAAMFVQGVQDVEISKEMELSRERVRLMRIEAERAGLFLAAATIAQAAAGRAAG